MRSCPDVASGRRVRRAETIAETIAEIVDVAIEVMGENGVAGLSLGEVARRVGIRPPSLYVYFDSKNAVYDAVYDAVFARGWQEVLLVFERLVELGLLRSDVPLVEIFRVWTVLTSGVITQQLANAPTEPFDHGSFTGLLRPLVDMYSAHYGTEQPRPRRTKSRTTSLSKTTATRRRHADQS